MAVATTSADGATSWQSGGGRRIVLAFAFLLLLPFYASLGPMLVQRITRGFIGELCRLCSFWRSPSQR